MPAVTELHKVQSTTKDNALIFYDLIVAQQAQPVNAIARTVGLI